MDNLSDWTVLILAGWTAIALAGCAAPAGRPTPITRTAFGTLPDGTAVDLFVLRNDAGAEAHICNYGGIVTTLKVPDRHGRPGDVVLGYDNLAGYLKASPHFGCLTGRYANRIAQGRFTLNGQTYSLAKNNGPNHLHGGTKGFDKVVWSAKPVHSALGPALELSYLSRDGEEGYPGNLNVTAVYTLTHDNALRLDFTATTDKATVCNLTHHSYFNLAGAGDVLNHEITIFADQFTPVDANLIPTGELRSLEGSPLDFRLPRQIGARLDQADDQLKLGGGYDHNYVLSKPAGQLGLAARAYEPTSGRVMEVLTTEPGVQFYTANGLDGSITGKGGWTYRAHHGFCFEPEHFPDSPNQPSFPSCVLSPGQTYRNTILYKFSAR